MPIKLCSFCLILLENIAIQFSYTQHHWFTKHKSYISNKSFSVLLDLTNNKSCIISMYNYITQLHRGHKIWGKKNCSSVLTHQHVFMIGWYQKFLCSNMDATKDYHTKWIKSDRERQVSYDIAYMWNLEKWYKWTYL